MSTTEQTRAAEGLRAGDQAASQKQAATKPLGGLAGWLDDRSGGAKGISPLMKKVFPDHWSFMLGEIAMYSMIICLLTGVFLSFWFVPSMTQVPYDGSYIPLQGVMVS
ncbi:MAG: ubiquinol-cytochrome c reductase cytochrome b subunit, partial [Dermatophilaceae bacterium]